MKFKPNAITVILCFCLIGAAKAQEKTKTVLFLKNSGKIVSTRDSADYISEMTDPDSGSTLYDVNEFYMDGKKKLSGKSSQKRLAQLEGVAEHYYPSGSLKQNINYVKGVKLGDGYLYFPNGKLHAQVEYLPLKPDELSTYYIVECRDSTGNLLVNNGNGYYKHYTETGTDFYEEGYVKNKMKDGAWKGRDKVNKVFIDFNEVYAEGNQISGRSVDENGNIKTYIKRTKKPEFTGGQTEFGRYLSKNIVYPKQSKKARISGKVFLSFVVTPSGTIDEIKVPRSPADDLSAEAVRVVEKMPNWQPGENYGIPVSVQYIVPINFIL